VWFRLHGRLPFFFIYLLVWAYHAPLFSLRSFSLVSSGILFTLASQFLIIFRNIGIASTRISPHICHPIPTFIFLFNFVFDLIAPHPISSSSVASIHSLSSLKHIYINWVCYIIITSPFFSYSHYLLPIFSVHFFFSTSFHFSPLIHRLLPLWVPFSKSTAIHESFPTPFSFLFFSELYL